MSDTLVRLMGWRATVLQGDVTVADRWRWLRRHLAPGPLRTLDAGCGTGAFTMYAALRGNRAVGVAFDAAQLARAERRAALVGLGPDRARFVVGDLRRLDEFGAGLGEFDQVLLFETIEHILDDRKLLRDLVARLRPGGRLLLTAPTKEHPPLWGEALSEVEDGGHVRWGYTHEEMGALFGAAGLEVTASEYISGLVSQKVASLTFGLRRLDDRLAWAATLPLRALRPLDAPLTRALRHPHLSIGVVGRKPARGGRASDSPPIGVIPVTTEAKRRTREAAGGTERRDRAEQGGPTVSGHEAWLRRLARRLVPRPVRNLARNPGATAAWLGQELAYRAGRTVAGPLRDDWSPPVHPASTAIYRAQRDDEDQRRELDEFVRRCRPGMVLYDIGASHGIFTLAALRYGGPEARVVAVDPSPTSNRLLRINLQLSGVEDRVELIEAAVGAEDGTLTMLTAGPAGDHYLIGVDEARRDACRIPQWTLPSLVQRAGGREPTHLKIDVEGFEGEVLRGAVQLLRRIRPMLFLEFHGALIRGRGRDPGEVLALLRDCGYERLLRHGRPISAEEAAERDLTRLVCLPEPEP